MPAPTLGRFRLDRPLGQGGMGVVWRAVHDVDDVAVAVKVQISRNATDPALVAQFHAEVRAIAALMHPAIIEVYDYGTVAERIGELVAGSPWLAMELAPHGTAEALCGTIGWAEQRDILIRLLEALAHAHATGLLHRDVKPSNVLLTDEGAKLADFGLATLESANAGTPAYMAPEQFDPGLADLSPATDLYAVGGLAWALATGHPINAGTSAFHARQFALRPAHVPFRSTHPVPDGLESWVRILLRRDAGGRFQQAADALVALRSLGEPVAVAPVTVRPAQRSDETAAWVPSGLADAGGTRPWTGEDAPVSARGPEPEAATPDAPPPPAPLPEDWHRPRRRATRHLNGVGLGLYGLRQVPIVGREAERERLWAALTDVHRARAPRVVILSGAAGSGKSRLAAWLAECAQEVGAATWQRAVYGHPAGPRDGLVPMIERWLGCERLDATAVRERVAARVPEGRDLNLLLRPPPGSKGLSDTARLDALCAAVRAMATDRPVVVWLDDAQWGEEVGPFVERILATDLPALLLLTVRAEALEDLPSAAAGLEALTGSPAVTSLPVPVLDHAAQDALVTALLGLHGAVADLVVARTGGNPLFATQLIGDWVQRGILVPEDGGFVVAEGADVTVPDAIHDLWTGRLARVLAGHAAEARVSLELAALLGVEVDRDEWADVCREAGVEPALDVVEAMQVRGLAVPRGEGWAFAHGMLAESISRIAHDHGRTSHHQGVVAAIHLRSATRYSDTGRAPEAELLLSRAERLLRASPHRHLWTQIARELALVWRSLGQANRAAAGVSSALESARALGDSKEEGEALSVMGILRSDGGDVDGALALFGEALALHRRVGNRRAEGILLANVGFAYMQQSRLEDALARYREAASIHQAVGNGHGEAKVLGQMGRIYLKQGRTDDAIRACTEGLVIARRSGNLMAVGMALGSIGLISIARGRMEEAVAAIDEALAIHRTVGDRGSEAHMLLLAGNVHKAAGRQSQALMCYRHALDITVELGARILEAYVHGEIGDLLVDERDHRTAHPHLLRAIEIFGEAGLVPEVGLYRSRLAQSLARQGDLIAARCELRRVGEAGLHAHRPVLTGQVACMRAEVERLAGDDSAARAALAEAEAIAEAIHATPDSEFGQMVAEQRRALEVGT